MKPRIKLAETPAPDGGSLTLYEHDGDYVISLGGRELMHSKATASELLLGTLGVAQLDSKEHNRVLIGGLGLGFTLKSVLSLTNKRCDVDVVELIPDIIEWNKTHLEKLNGKLLETTRVKVRPSNVIAHLHRTKPGTYDAIMMDIDNGPVAMVAKENSSLYSERGIQAMMDVLKPEGRAVVWSASLDKRFEKRLKQARLQFKSYPAKIHEKAKKPSYILYVITAPSA